MVDSEALYGVQERELQRRLPHVPLYVIKHFLAQHQGNFDECYQRLRSQTPQPLSPDMEQFYPDFSRTTTLHTSRPTQYQPRPPQDHRAVRRHPTWDSGSQTLPLRSQRHATHDTRQLYGQGGVYMHSGVYDAAQGMGSTHSVQQPPQGWTTSFPREVPTNHSVQQPPQTWTTSFPREVPTNQGVIAVNRLSAQRQQLEAIHKYQERLVHHLSFKKEEVDQKQQKLSGLRLEVSALTTEQQISELREVIQTLEIDLREAKCDLQVHKVQSQLKQDQDLYTDEGVRWYCKDCSFLNHPLMTICEKCNIPKFRAH